MEKVYSRFEKKEGFIPGGEPKVMDKQVNKKFKVFVAVSCTYK